MWHRILLSAMALALVLAGCQLEGLVTTSAPRTGMPEIETPGAGVTPTAALSGTLAPGVGSTVGATISPSLGVTSTLASPSPRNTLTGTVSAGPSRVFAGTITPSLGITPAVVSPSLAPTSTTRLTPERAITTTVMPGINSTPGISPTVGPTGTVVAGFTLTATRALVPGAPGQGPAQFMLRDLDSLEQFRSYRTTTVITWTPEAGDETVFNVLREATTIQGDLSQDARYHTVVILTRAGRQEARIEFVTANSQTWTREGGAWRLIPVSPETFLNQIGWLGNPQDLLKDDQPGRFVRTEMVNGMQAWHYRYGFNAFQPMDQLGQLDSGEADVWIHPDYRVIVHMVANASGSDQAGNLGRLHILSNLTDVNSPIQFNLPPDLQPTRLAPGITPQAGQPPLLAQHNIPLMQGATEIRSLSDVVIYRVQNSPAEVIAFYRARLQQQGGWRAGEQDQGTGQAAQFTRNGATVDIIAARGQAANQSIVAIVVNQSENR